MFGFKRAKPEAFSDVLDQMGPSVAATDVADAVEPVSVAHAATMQSQDWLLQLLSGMVPADTKTSATPPVFEASYYEDAPHPDETMHLEDAVAPLLEAIANCEQDAIAEELGLHANMSENELKKLRRDFARLNHPDRLAPSKRDVATHRMTIANMLIDRELRKPSLR